MTHESVGNMPTPTVIEGLSPDETVRIVDGGMEFLRVITEVYGPSKGQELWNSMTECLGDNIKGAIFFAMITGGHQLGHVTFSGKAYNKVNAIKAIRYATGMGLKEAKDAADAAENQAVRVKTLDHKNSRELVSALNYEGMHAR